MGYLKLLKKYRLVITASGIALAAYMYVHDTTDKATALLVGFVFALVHLLLDDIE